MAKYLDESGLSHFWGKIKSWIRGYVTVSVDGSGDKTITYKYDPSSSSSSEVVIQPITTAERTKLGGIATGAEVNQNAFSNIKVGSTTVAADSKTDTLELVAGTNISLSPDATNDKVTINVTGIADGAEVNQNAFSNVKVGSTTIAADSKTDTLELTAGSNITLTPDATNDKVTIGLSESPALSGTPTAPTAGAGTNSTQIATTQFVQTAVTNGTGNIVVDGITGSTINRYGSCSTAADTAAKAVTITSGTVPTLNADANGLQVTVKFANASTASNPTLNVNSKGAKKIYHRGSQITTGTNKALLAGVCTFIYDNSLDSNSGGWHLIGNYYDTTYTVGNKALKVSSNSGDALQAITVNESSADRTLQIKGDGTYLTGAVSGSANAPVITISHNDPTADANSELTGSISGTAGSYALGTEYTVLTGVKAQRDAKGHVTGLTYTAQKVKDTDTKNTAGSTDSSSKLFIVGATSQATNPQTYSQDTAYVGTDGHLYSDSKQVVNLSGSQALTNKTYNGYTLSTACAKGVDTSIGSSSSSNLPTTDAVKTYVSSQMSSVTGALVYKGTVSAESSLLSTALSKGWYYIVTMPDVNTTSVTIGGFECEAGDMIIVKTAGTYTTTANLGNAIDVIQSNIARITNTDIDGLPEMISGNS